MSGSLAAGCVVITAASLAGCGAWTRQPPAVSHVPDPGSSFDRVLRVHVRDYTESPVANVQLATEQQTPAIAPTDQAGNTSIRYRSERLSVFVLNPKEMLVLSPWRGDVDLTKDPERLIIAPKGKPIIFKSATTLRPIATQVLSASPPEGGVGWPEANALVANELNIDAAELNRTLRTWEPKSGLMEDQALAALCRNDLQEAERAVESAGGSARSSTVQFVRAQTMAVRRDYSASAAAASEAVALDPANRAFSRSLGFSLANKGDVRGAAAAFLASGCTASGPACGGLETVSTYFAARSLEEAERIQPAAGAYKLVAASASSPKLAAAAQERLRRLGSVDASPPTPWPAIVPSKYLPWILGGVVLGALLWQVVRMLRGPKKASEDVEFELLSVPKSKPAATTAVLVILVVAGVLGLGPLFRVDLGAPPQPGQIHGTIRDREGNVVAGATIRIVEYGTEPVVSDQNGQFRLRLREAGVPYVLVHAQKQGYAPAVTTVDSTAAPNIVLRSF